LGEGVKDRGPGTEDGCFAPVSRLPSPGPRPPRTIIFTADDFGLSPALNGAVALAQRRGLLACASLMAAGPHFLEAVRLARELFELRDSSRRMIVKRTAPRD
jgi:hypothetical protein